MLVYLTMITLILGLILGLIIIIPYIIIIGTSTKGITQGILYGEHDMNRILFLAFIFYFTIFTIMFNIGNARNFLVQEMI